MRHAAHSRILPGMNAEPNTHQLESLDHHRWQACLDKDAGFDGQFVFGVRTTGIYCRPSCTARTPLRKNVRFFATPDDAEQAGLRACKRCLPREGAAPDAAADLARQAAAIIQQSGRARLDELSAQLHISPFHLQRTFKKVMGVSPLQFARAYRINAVKHGLKQGQSVTTAIYDAGFNNSSSLYEQTPAIGMTPSAYQRGGRGMQIGYAITNCVAGRMLVAATTRGLCAVYFGDSDQGLIAMLREEYPAAEIAENDQPHTVSWARQIAGYWNGNEPYAALAKLPLDVQGTAFQARVWQAIREIPAGVTQNYGEIARAIGEPGATRAVANACGANRVGVVIPCHRVVRADGALGGYRWGAERKRQLLTLEHAPA